MNKSILNAHETIIEVLETDSKYDLWLQLNKIKNSNKSFHRFDVSFSTHYTTGSSGCNTYYCALVVYEPSKE